MNPRPQFLLVFSIVLAFLLASCGPDGHHGRLEGKLQGVNEAKILAYTPMEADADAGRLDTIEVKHGEFSYERPLEGPVILRLLYPNFSQTTLVMEPGQTVKLKGDANRLKEIALDGNADNLMLTEFRQRLLKAGDADAEREAATFVRSHPTTLAALAVFYDFFAEKETLEANPAETLLETLTKAQPSNDMLRRLSAHLQPLYATAPGKKLPDFSATDFDGRKISRADLLGKPTFIVFCSQWQGSFFQMGSHADAIRQQFPAAKLNLLFVVLDERESSLRKRLKSRPLPGRIVCDGKGLSSPLPRKLGMRYVGGNILVDSRGTILARDLDLQRWNEHLPKFLKEN